MDTSKNKVRLSPRMRLGVGRNYSHNNLLKYSGFLFLFISVALASWTIYVIARGPAGEVTQTTTPNPQVLGVADNPASAFTEYTVVKGDTIFNISQKYNVSWTTVATINNIESPFTLKIGQKLKIPVSK